VVRGKTAQLLNSSSESESVAQFIACDVVTRGSEIYQSIIDHFHSLPGNTALLSLLFG